MKKLFLLLFVVGSLLFINTPLVNACSCIVPDSQLDLLEISDAVFLGRVLDIDRKFEGYGYSVKFEVEKYWKGIFENNVIIGTGFGGGDCGYRFENGEDYLVYAYGDNTLSTNSCSRTKLLASAQDDLRELGEGNLPTNSGSNYVPQIFNFVLFVSILGIATVLFGFLIKKYKK